MLLKGPFRQCTPFRFLQTSVALPENCQDSIPVVSRKLAFHERRSGSGHALRLSPSGSRHRSRMSMTRPVPRAGAAAVQAGVSPASSIDSVEFLEVRIDTDAGVTGHGFNCNYSKGLKSAKVMIDECYGPAVVWGRRLEQFDIAWLEEPMHPFDVRAHAELAKAAASSPMRCSRNTAWRERCACITHRARPSDRRPARSRPWRHSWAGLE